jgi:hypothetical protein
VAPPVGDNQNLLDSLRKIGSTSASVQANSRYTPSVRTQVSVNDDRLKALRSAPQFADEINAVASGQAVGSGALGTVGKLLFDNPVAKAALSGLQAIDVPRRAVISAVREITDLVDSDPATQASFSDFMKQTSDTSFGFGTAFPMDGWRGRVLGFVGDVALDPLVYATLGSYVPAKVAVKTGMYAGQSLRSALGVRTLAGADGRFALARLAKQMGATDDVVKNVAARGRLGLTPELADNMGLKRAGIYYFGTRVRVPLSGPVADLVQKSLVNTRLGFFKPAIGEKIGRQFALRGTGAGDTSAQRFALATGKTTPAEAGAFIGEFAAQDIFRAQQRTAVDTAVKYARGVMNDPSVRASRSTVYRLLDTSPEKWTELGLNPSAAEISAYDRIKLVFERMHRDVEAAYNEIGVPVSFGKIEDYLPWVASDRGLRMMSDASSPYAVQIRQYLTVNQTDNVGSFRSRNLKAGSEWFGSDGKFPPLTQKDIDGGVSRLNQLFRERTGFDFDFFETDIQKILDRYSGYYGQQIGSARYMGELLSSGQMQLARQVPEFNDEVLNIVHASVRAATNEVSTSLKETFDAGRKVAADLGEVFKWSTRAKATVTRPVGPLRKQLADAEAALKAIPPEEVALARLESAEATLKTTMDKLEAAYRGFSDQFLEDSVYLDMLRTQHDSLMKAHQDVLDQVVYIAKNYKDDISPSGAVGLKEDFNKVFAADLDSLKGQLSELDGLIETSGRTWENMLAKQSRLLDDFESLLSEPFAGLGRTADEKILGILRFRGTKTGIQSEKGQRLFSRWSGKNVSSEVSDLRKQLDPFNEFSGLTLEKVNIDDVRRIISSGFTSASDLRELRLAANWLVARDVIRNNGLIPTDAEFFGRFEKLKVLVDRSNKVESFIRNAVVEGSPSANLANSHTRLNRLKAEASELFDQMEYVDSRIAAGETIEGIDDAGRISLTNLNEQFDELIKKRRDVDNQIVKEEKNLELIKSSMAEENRDAVSLVMSGNFSELAEELAEATSEYYFHSQANGMFREVMEEAAELGLIPTEQMYNALITKITQYDLELAQASIRSIDDVTNIFKAMNEKVKAYAGVDVNAFFVDDLMDLFNNPSRVVEADKMRDMFPEVEVILMRHVQQMRPSRAMFEADRGEEIAQKIVDTMNRFALPFDRGLPPTPSPRPVGRSPRTLSMVRDGADLTADLQGIGVRQVGMKYSSAQEMERRAASAKKYIEKLRKYVDEFDADTIGAPLGEGDTMFVSGVGTLAGQQNIDSVRALIQEYDDMIVRVNKKQTQAKRVLKTITGASGARTSVKRIENILKLGDSFGIASPLKSALEGGPYALDSFFADLIGGTKLDVSAGFRTTKLQGGKLVRAAEGRDAFVNVFEDKVSPGRFVDSNNRPVNLAGELLDESGEVIMERVPNPSPTGEPFIMVPKMGRKSPRPTVTVPFDRSRMSEISYRSKSRFNKLRSVSDDFEFIPAENIMRGTLNPKGDTTWVFADNLYGPKAYANQLELYLEEIEGRVKQAGKVSKEIERQEKALDKANEAVAKGKPTKAQTSLLRSRINAARAAERRLNDLTQSDIHLRAIERKEFNEFLMKFASIDPDKIQSIRWGLSALDSGFPVSRSEVLKVNNLHIQALERSVKRMQDEAAQILRMPRSRVEMRSVRLNELRRGIDDSTEEIARLRTQLEQAQLPAGSGDDFGFSRDEFLSLWSDGLTPQQVGALRTEYAKLGSQLNARVGQKHTPAYRGWDAKKIADNDDWIDVVKARMDEIDSALNVASSRDVSIRKAKFLFDNFDDVSYQSRIGVAKYKTVDRSTTRLPSNRSGGELGTRLSTSEPIKEKSRTALTRFLRTGEFADRSGRITSRRDVLRSTYEDSPEFLHLKEVEEASNLIKIADEARLGYNEKRDRLIGVRDDIKRTIAEKREALKQLEVGEVVGKINELLDEAAPVVGRRLPKVGKADPAKGVARAQEALEGQVESVRASRRYFSRNEEMFGTLEEAQNGALSALQSRHRDITQKLYRLELAALAEKQAQKEAVDAIRMLVSMSDQQAKALGLPTAKQISKNMKLAEGLNRGRGIGTSAQRVRQAEQIAEASGKQVDKAKAAIDAKFIELDAKVQNARAVFDVSSSTRRSVEENVDLAKRQIAEVRDLNERLAAQRSAMRKKSDDWTEGFDDFVSEVSFLMPLIEGTEYDKALRDSLASYVSAKAGLMQARYAESAALQEQKMLQGIKSLVTSDADEAALTAAFAGQFGVAQPVNMVKMFDEGFVQLSRYFPDVGVRKELAEIVQNVHRAQDPVIVRELSKFLSAYTKFFKGYATLSPGFHLRNAMTNGFMLFGAGGRPKFLAEGLPWSKSWTEASRKGITFDAWIKTVPQGERKTVSDAFMASAASGGGLTDDALKEGGLFGTKTSKKVGQWLEQHSRFLLAYDGIRSGMDMQQAAARVRRYLIDYENVSSADMVMRQIIPFWMWTSRNLPMQVLNIWQNPRSYQIYGSLKRNLERSDEQEIAVPLWMREMGAFKLPFGKNIYATPDFGFNRLNQDVEQLRDPARFAANLNPLIRLPIELAGGRQLYSGRQFSDTPVEVSGGVSTVIQPLLQALGYGETGPTGKRFVDDKPYYALRSLFPTLSQAERLIPSTPEYQQRGITNPLLGYLGVPGRQVTAGMSESEVKRMQRALREISKRGKVLMEGDE